MNQTSVFFFFAFSPNCVLGRNCPLRWNWVMNCLVTCLILIMPIHYWILPSTKILNHPFFISTELFLLLCFCTLLSIILSEKKPWTQMAQQVCKAQFLRDAFLGKAEGKRVTSHVSINNNWGLFSKARPGNLRHLATKQRKMEENCHS